MMFSDEAIILFWWWLTFSTEDDKQSILFYFAKPHNFGDCHDDGYDNHQPEDKGEERRSYQ